MKKLFVIALAAITFTACNTGEDNTTTTETTTENTTMDRTPSDGDVTYRDNRLRVYRNGNWTDADNDVTLENGTVVSRDGRVRREDREVRLQDGEVVSRTGDFFDRTGRAINNAWDATKEGARDAGNAVERAADKVGEKTRDVFDGDSTRR
ncbi:DUF6799 domain-containing protein [Aridibaculum aurantiacum]|uniref:DUF6799 domain-containing protein n=1 Tax=Aridibaculum aurantiacum TaxID=2810307 RepID=UPI001A95DCB2|nr:DUF6799 domain-containing protein [Aridibaculum aurantiacum]